MNGIPLCRVGLFSPFLEFLNQLGSPTERLLRNAKLPSFILEDPEALIPIYQAFDFIAHAAQLEKIEMLGVAVGQQTHISDLGLLGQILHQSLTLYDLIRTLEQIIPCVNSTERVWLKEEEELVWFHHHFIFSPTTNHQQARLYALMLYLKAIQLATGTSWQPAALRLTGSSFDVSNIEELANVPISFNCPTDAIAIPKALLSLPLQKSPKPHPLLSQDSIQQWQESAPASSFSDSLKQLLQSLLPDEYPDIHTAAEASGLSVRSFQRRLAAEQLSYSQVVEQVRFDQAVQMLNSSCMQLVDVASELGYTDAANFTRAFKRWTGISPRQFRRLHEQNAVPISDHANHQN